MSKTVQNINKNNQTDSRSDKLKLYSIGSIVLLIAIALLANILFDKILGKPLTFDFSENLSNSLSQQSIDYLNSLPQDTKIRIVGLFDKPSDVSGTEYQYIAPLLDDYVRNSNGKITVEYVDPSRQPAIINELDPNNAYKLSTRLGCYVIKYNDKLKVVDTLDCYSFDSEYLYRGYYYVTANNTEFTFTNSMFILTNGYSCKAYLVTGLEEDSSEYLKKILESMSIEAIDLPVSENFKVPDDCDFIIINGPNNDISEKVYVALSEYIGKGGKLLVAVNYSMNNVSEDYVRLNKLLNQMNINIDPALIAENDPDYQLSGYQLDHTVRSVGAFRQYANVSFLHATYSRSVRNANVPNNQYVASPVLQTSENAVTTELDAKGNTIESSVKIGQFNAAMYTTLEGNDPSKAFVFGTMNFTSDEYISTYGLNDVNMDFIRSCLSELTSSKEFAVLNVPVKSVEDFSLDTTKATTSSSTVILAVFMIVIPLALVAVAVFVYAKRKNL